MAQDPKNYRDPKVTQPSRGSTSSGGAMRWVWIGLAVIVVLAILAWLFGWNTTNTVATRPVDDATIVAPAEDPLEETGEAAATAVEEAEQGVEGAVDATGDAAQTAGDALEATTEETGEALEGAAQETGDAIEGAAETAGDAAEAAGDELEGAVEDAGEAAQDVGDEVETEIVPVEPID